jgi:hypothetical protein
MSELVECLGKLDRGELGPSSIMKVVVGEKNPHPSPLIVVDVVFTARLAGIQPVCQHGLPVSVKVVAA